MSKEQSAIRIREAMDIRGMKQCDLCKASGISKSALSQYLSGKFEPKQDKIFFLAKALNVDPSWLMGYDVPMVKLTEKKELLPEDDQLLLDLFHKVPEDKREIVLAMIKAAIKGK